MEALALAVLQAKEMAERAAEIYTAAKERFITGAATTGQRSVEVDGHKVTATPKERRSFDVDTLANLVPHSVFAKVTKPVIDLRKFDAAVEIGTIDGTVAGAVTEVTPYVEVRVTSR